MSMNIMAEHNRIDSSIPDIHFRANALSVEDGEMLTKVADYFSNKLQEAGTVLTASVGRIFDNNLSGLMSRSELQSYKSRIDNIKQNVKYNNVSAVQVPVTLGMKTDLHTSVREIFYVIDVLKKDVPKTIAKMDETVSKMLSNKDFRTSGRPFKDDNLGDIKIRFNTLLNKLIDPDGVDDRKTVRDLLPNLSSLDEIAVTLSALSELSDKKLLKSIVKQSNEISSNIDYLYEEYKKNNTGVKKERLIELGYHLEEGAKVITQYVTIIHLISQFTDTFKHLLKALDK